MSDGFKSASRLVVTVPSVCPKAPLPEYDASKLSVLKLELSIGTPSTTKSGWFDPRIVLMPRMLMNEPAPGSPDCCSTVTLGAFAASASTRFVSPERWIRSDATLFARCRVSRWHSRCQHRSQPLRQAVAG